MTGLCLNLKSGHGKRPTEMGVRKLLLGKARLHYVLPLSALSLLTRALADLAHLPLYLDATGTLLAASLLGPWHAALTGLISGVFLTAYYQAYALMIVPLAVVGFIFGRSLREGSSWALVGAFITALAYQLSWLSVYTATLGVWSYFGTYITSQGSFGLLADAFTSIFLASLSSEAVKFARARLENVRKRQLLFLAVFLSLLAAAPLAALAEMACEEEFKAEFPRDPNYVFVCTRMDLVWLPMWRKGTNYYYYPHDRFDRGSPGYQVWVGMYWIQGYVPLTVETVAMFAIWDQNAWLRLHGCPAPYTTIAIVENITDITFKGYRAKLMYGSLYTRSDVGPDYEHLRLDGFFIVFYDARRDRTGIIYACATAENFGAYVGELWRMVEQFPIGA